MFSSNTITLSSFSKRPNLRLGSYYELPEIRYPYIPLTSVFSRVESGSRPAGGINPMDHGQAISLGGEQIGANGFVVNDHLPYVADDYYESVTKGRVSDNDILICKDGALTGKTCIVELAMLPTSKVMVNEHVYVVRGNEKVEQLFLFYLLRTKVIQRQIRDFAYKKKGQPGLNRDHMMLLRVPDVPKREQESFVAEIQPILSEIKDLRRKIVSIDSIIDTVFMHEFSFDYTAFEELKRDTINKLTLSRFSNNTDLRFSAKFHRRAGDFVMQQLTNLTDKKIRHFLKEPIILGASVSPEDYSETGEYYYISMATIKGWEFDPSVSNVVSKAYSDSNIEKVVAKDDILLARSGEGTIGKVALINNADIKGIFSDFTMRIRLRDCDPEFAYYYFRTGYFQYLIEVYKKGLGNNTNIFPVVVQDFPMINASGQKEKRIIDAIKSEIISQQTIKSEIANKQLQIDKIMDKIVGAV